MSMAVKYGMKKRMAKGGDVKSHKGQGDDSGTPGGVHADVSRKEWGSGARQGTSLAGEHTRGASRAKEAGQNRAHASRSESAKNLHKEALSKLKSDKGDRTNLAEGGEVEADDPAKKAADSMRKAFHFADGGMVDRIMGKRKGGETADEQPAEYDPMELEPAPEADYPGSNEHGNEALDENDQDLISRIMRSRAKRDSMPRPA